MNSWYILLYTIIAVPIVAILLGRFIDRSYVDMSYNWDGRLDKTIDPRLCPRCGDSQNLDVYDMDIDYNCIIEKTYCACGEVWENIFEKVLIDQVTTR